MQEGGDLHSLEENGRREKNIFEKILKHAKALSTPKLPRSVLLRKTSFLFSPPKPPATAKDC